MMEQKAHSIFAAVQMSEDAMKSGNITVNPRAVSIKDVEALYEKTI